MMRGASIIQEWPLCLRAGQGKNEEQTKSYSTYHEGAPQFLTQSSAKSGSSVSGSARKQAATAQRPFAVFDIDGTIIRWQLYHAIIDTLVQQGHIDRGKFMAVRELLMQWKRRLDENAFNTYEHAMVDLYDDALRKLTRSDFLTAAQRVFDEYKDQTYTYTRDLIRELKKQNYLLFAISGSQQEIVAMLAAYYGFDDYGGSRYTYTEDDRFTGSKFVMRSQEKPRYLKQLIEKHGATYAGSIAVGDSEGDIPMLEIVEQPIAFNPSKGLFERAQADSWRVVVERKNMIYTLEAGDDSYRLLA